MQPPQTTYAYGVLHFTENGRALLGVSISFTTLAVLAVILRLSSRRIKRLSVGLDDSWVILATLSLCTLCGLSIWSAVVGGAQNLNEQPKEIQIKSFETFLKAQYISDVFFIFTMSANRYSLTCLFRKIFPVKSLRVMSLILDAFNFAYLISTIFVSVFSCHPVDYLWHPVPGGGCLKHFNLFGYITGSFGVFLDLAVLTLPINPVRKLQMAKRTEILLLSIFSLGGFVVITGIVRVVLIYNPSGAYVNFLNSAIWTMIQAATGVVCVNLPTYKPLFPKITSITRSFRNYYRHLRSGSQRDIAATYGSSKTLDARSSYSNQARTSHSQQGSQVHLAWPGAENGPATEHDAFELDRLQLNRNQIQVNNTVHIV